MSGPLLIVPAAKKIFCWQVMFGGLIRRLVVGLRRVGAGKIEKGKGVTPFALQIVFYLEPVMNFEMKPL